MLWCWCTHTSACSCCTYSVELFSYPSPCAAAAATAKGPAPLLLHATASSSLHKHTKHKSAALLAGDAAMEMVAVWCLDGRMSSWPPSDGMQNNLRPSDSQGEVAYCFATGCIPGHCCICPMRPAQQQQLHKSSSLTGPLLSW
jgi:hypothetical protein